VPQINDPPYGDIVTGVNTPVRGEIREIIPSLTSSRRSSTLVRDSIVVFPYLNTAKREFYRALKEYREAKKT